MSFHCAAGSRNRLDIKFNVCFSGGGALTADAECRGGEEDSEPAPQNGHPPETVAHPETRRAGINARNTFFFTDG